MRYDLVLEVTFPRRSHTALRVGSLLMNQQQDACLFKIPVPNLCTPDKHIC